MKRSTPVWLGAIASTALLLVASPAMAGENNPPPGPDPEAPPAQTLYEGFVAPLSLSLDPSGAVWVTDNFAGTLNAVSPEGENTVVYTATPPGTEVGAVSTTEEGTTYFAERVGDLASVSSAVIRTLGENGEATTLADILAFETAENPDADQHYGFSDLDAECEAQLPADVPLDYYGTVDSHPYATLPAGDNLLVADAGANAILSVSLEDGEVSTVAVLPAQRAIVGDWGAELGIPECAIGHPFDFEPVPTDLEYGPDGELYVTLLPGGPEDPSAGARGSVVRIDTANGGGHHGGGHHGGGGYGDHGGYGDRGGYGGHDGWGDECEGDGSDVTIETVASELAGATGLAVSPDGDIYVAELFGNRISVIEAGGDTAETFREVNAPAALEWSEDGLYATADALPPLGPTPPGEPPVTPPAADVPAAAAQVADPAPAYPDPAGPSGPTVPPTEPTEPPTEPTDPPAGKLVFFPFEAD